MAPATGTGGADGGSAMAAGGGSGGAAMAAYSASHARTVARDTPHSRAAAETLVDRSGRSASWASASALLVLRMAGRSGRSFFGRRGSALLPWVVSTIQSPLKN